MCVYVCAIAIGRRVTGCIDGEAVMEALVFEGEDGEVGDDVVLLARVVVRFTGVDGAEEPVVGAMVLRYRQSRWM